MKKLIIIQKVTVLSSDGMTAVDTAQVWISPDMISSLTKASGGTAINTFVVMSNGNKFSVLESFFEIEMMKFMVDEMSGDEYCEWLEANDQ